MAIAFFDLDNTLVNGDTAQAFSEFLVTSSLPTSADFLAMNHAYMYDYDAGKLNLAEYMRYTLSPLKFQAKEQIDLVIQTFIAQKVSKMALPKANALLAEHQQQGDTLVIISATGSHLVKPIAQFLGVEHALGVDVERENGEITGEIVGVPSFREGKVQRALEWSQAHGVSMEGCYFYSDSHNDLPLLEKANYPIAVDADPILRKVAEQRDWPLISLR